MNRYYVELTSASTGLDFECLGGDEFTLSLYIYADNEDQVRSMFREYDIIAIDTTDERGFCVGDQTNDD